MSFTMPIALAGFLFSCGTPGPHSASFIVSRLPEKERSMVEQFMDTREQSIVSIHYGPEWRTLRIISRSVQGNELIAIGHRWEGSAFDSSPDSFASEVLYTTGSERMIRLFNDFREQIAQTPPRAHCDYPVVSTSNPSWAAHVLPDSDVGIILEWPWSTRNCYRMAMATTLMNAAVNDPELQGPIIPQEYYSIKIAHDTIAQGVSIEDDGAIDSWQGWYIHIVLSLFDLEREFVEHRGR